MSHALNIHDGLGIIAQDPALGIMLAYGNTTPVDGTPGYAPGCHWIKTNGNTLANSTVINIGTKSSALFTATYVSTNGILTLTNKTLTAPVINAGTGTSLAMTAGITSSGGTSGIGYATGAGGTVTQGTSRTTGVTLSKMCGNIVLFSAAGSATPFSFTVTNTAVAVGDVVIINQKSGTDLYTTQVVTAVGAGSFQVTLANASGATVESPVFNFSVIKGVAA